MSLPAASPPSRPAFLGFPALSGWSSAQRHVVVASLYLGWTLDAFDFFLLVFVIKDVAGEFGTTDIPTSRFAVTLTLAMRPVGAFIFRAGSPTASAGGRS